MNKPIPSPAMMPKTRKDETPKKEYHLPPHLNQRPFRNHEGLAALTKGMTMVEDILNYYKGIHQPIYLVATQSVRVGSEKDFKRALLAFWFDPELMESKFFKGINPWSSITNWSVLTEDHLKMSFIETSRRKLLCCERAMFTDGVGHGCAEDIDKLLQWALFGEIRYE